MVFTQLMVRGCSHWFYRPNKKSTWSRELLYLQEDGENVSNMMWNGYSTPRTTSKPPRILQALWLRGGGGERKGEEEEAGGGGEDFLAD